ncbi:cyclic nucleotide-binding domain-containing protein [Leptospira sp. 2 VSF19]|uniref:Cyclic nucleotide-binding domain-containing protein n=1 Tax=Leptospira soteropolitanensis TaxID=2950025 RepID=A0AAW5VJ99_9LEPT|nr:cyclic nucleotide-binding domain-containing protein [Leptospira soteropolitanensis]MCW7492733.1 cyclic nucleotide-binding domain-containing protein [Leptospira soteropolitanensis]MCW7500416.1 cyclic nucleotide-binding domain-containing protein [Leptospira soteropolitanensis]MCW7522549.1 cyclic nucleotide-binding domain-containing protein [Leptospira soteropolitanensis]MCW7526405.1 cyclic nucleotide-binding domain-containing protein [Leptospira soteropolitanensis]MCW7530386.1 cyclic nucleoti
MSKLNIPPNQRIFKEGELNNAMYIILQGNVEIFFTVNNSQTRLALMKPGDFFGEMALFSSNPRSATARTITNCEVAVIESKQQLENFLVKNPKFAAKMVSIMADRLARTNELLISSMEKSVAKKIEFSNEVGKEHQIGISDVQDVE